MGGGLHEEVRPGRGRGRQLAAHPEGVVPLLHPGRARGDAIALDEIGSGPERARRRAPALLVALALVLGIGGVATNSVFEHRELDRLLARAVDAQGAIAYSNHRVAATVDYTRPLLFGASVPDRVRAGLQQLVEDSAATQVDGVAAERNGTRAVSVLPWHRALGRARAALVTYLDARVAYLRSVAADQHVLYVEHPELDRLLDSARSAFRDAAGPSDRRRVDAAFAGGTHPA